MSICLSICRENAASTGWIVVKFDTVLSNQQPVKKVWLKSDKNNMHFTQTYINVGHNLLKLFFG